MGVKRTSKNLKRERERERETERERERERGGVGGESWREQNKMDKKMKQTEEDCIETSKKVIKNGIS